jgi:hypothetical protein
MSMKVVDIRSTIHYNQLMKTTETERFIQQAFEILDNIKPGTDSCNVYYEIGRAMGTLRMARIYAKLDCSKESK